MWGGTIFEFIWLQQSLNITNGLALYFSFKRYWHFYGRGGGGRVYFMVWLDVLIMFSIYVYKCIYENSRGAGFNFLPAVKFGLKFTLSKSSTQFPTSSHDNLKLWNNFQSKSLKKSLGHTLNCIQLNVQKNILKDW